MFQKDRVARNLIKFYEIFQKQSTPETFEQICERYLRANLEVIEREKQLADRVNEIQIEFQDMGEQQFMSKYATN
jgi:hypothetical protein